LLLGKSVNRRNADGSYTQIINETNEYQVSSLSGTIQNVRCAVLFDAGIPTDEVSTIRPINAPEDEIVFSYYDHGSEYIALKENRVTSFSNDRVITTKTEYYYDNSQHLLPNRIVKTIDHNEKEITVINYPQDYVSGTAFIDALITANNISAPIESVSLRQDISGAQAVVSGQLFIYNDDGKGLLANVKQVETAEGINLTSFNFSNRAAGIIPSASTTKTIFSPYNDYVTKAMLRAYQGGGVAEGQGADDVTQSYIWDYDNQYVIASVKNALNKDVAFTSFETSSRGKWNVTGGQVNSSTALTGINSYTISSGDSFAASGLTLGKYKVSYWSKSGPLTAAGTVMSTRQKGSWTYYEHVFDNVTTVLLAASSNNVIDDLRLYPVGAQMTSYTYKSLIGVSSISDTNSNPVYYEYDTNGRLKVLRDADGNIVSHYKYHYKGE
jgi:YD repeat-containing protein